MIVGSPYSADAKTARKRTHREVGRELYESKKVMMQVEPREESASVSSSPIFQDSFHIFLFIFAIIKISSKHHPTSLKMKQPELIFIPSPGLSHTIATVEAAKLLIDRDDRLSITVLVMKSVNDHSVDDYTRAASTASPSCLRFISLPDKDENTNMFDHIKSQKSNVREIVSNLFKEPSLPGSHLAGLVLDMFCTTFIDIAVDFNLPSYVFFTSSAAALGLFCHLCGLKFEQNRDLTVFKNSDEELLVPCYSNPVPGKALPAVFVVEGLPYSNFLEQFRRLTEAKGIMVNTFHELEPYAIGALSSDVKYPRVYPIGPIFGSISSGKKSQSASGDHIMKWLDSQPGDSVVFLCFGTRGNFDESQVREIAMGLENSGARFLWSLRMPGPKGGSIFPADCENLQEVLPEGFLERTNEVGKVIGWAPQVEVLAHPAVGGFVSHCGWNSILESVWFGTPIATLPLYAEQQANAFELVKELGIAEEIRIDYRTDLKMRKESEIVHKEEIETAIRRLMSSEEEGGSGVRRKAKEMQKKSRMALEEGGSSYNALGLFIQDVIKNIT